MKQPNILLLTTDQHRCDYNQGGAVPGLRLPAMARLRDEGATLVNSYSVCPICSPTRISWNHGIYPSQVARHSHRTLPGFVPRHLPAFPAALRQAGYSTALIGKLHYRPGGCTGSIPDTAGLVRDMCGYDHLLEVSGKSLACSQQCAYTRYLAAHGLLDHYLADVRSRIHKKVVRCEPYRVSSVPAEHCMDAFIGRHVREYLETVDAARPFFLHASFCNPHFPYDPPEPYFSLYRPEDMPAPRGVEDPAHIRYWQEIRAAYCGLLNQLDDEIGALLGVLERRGLLDNTAIFFISDHGDLLGDYHYEFSKIRPDDTSARTPLTVRLPGRIPAGATLDAPFESVDLPATILEAAGLGPEPRKFMPASPGRSAWDYLAGRAAGHRDWAYAEFGDNQWYHAWRMVVDRDWKYIFDQTAGDRLIARANDPFEEGNRIADPDCLEILAARRRNLVQSMTASLMPPYSSFYADGK